MERLSVEHFLPLYQAERMWKNGRARVDFPLFPGYVFVRIALGDRLQVLRVPGVVRLVGFSDIPTPLPENDITIIRSALANGIMAEPFPYLKLGSRVRVRSGPLEGLEGVLHHKKGKSRLVVSVDAVMQSIAIEVDAKLVEPADRSSAFRLAREQMMRFDPGAKQDPRLFSSVQS
jgi:transcription antitermination factor NusG